MCDDAFFGSIKQVLRLKHRLMSISSPGPCLKQKRLMKRVLSRQKEVVQYQRHECWQASDAKIEYVGPVTAPDCWPAERAREKPPRRAEDHTA